MTNLGIEIVGNTIEDARETLIKYLKRYVHNNHINDGSPLLTINLDCGCTTIFDSYKDIPHKSIKCRHGKYYIKYVIDKKIPNWRRRLD